jgi:hypothetical protein
MQSQRAAWNSVHWLILSIATSGWAAVAAPVSLFDGRTLNGWDVLTCEAEVQDGAILLKAGNGLVQSSKKYRDFVLAFEWKALRDDNWDSGVYFRYDEVPAGRPWPQRYQVNLRQGMEGNLDALPAGNNAVPTKAREWNRFELTVRGPTASLRVNGQAAWQVDGLAELDSHIALQAEVPGGGQFLFRDIQLTELTGRAEVTDMQQDLPLVFSEDFEQGTSRWETTDDKAWEIRDYDGNKAFGLNRRVSDYQPQYRSPHNIALIEDLEVRDFDVQLRVRSTLDTGGHRDCCIFFGYQSPTQFYYVHLGASPDPNSGQIMIVNNAPRTPITNNTNPTPWDDKWHLVKVVRRVEAGTIDIYFDDMTNPLMTATDKTFGKGRIGIGSFDDMNDFDEIRVFAEVSPRAP